MSAMVLQRQCACGAGSTTSGECEECKKRRRNPVGLLQRSATDRGAPQEAPPIVHDVLRSPGQPLGDDVRGFMESRLGYDLSRVRVHTDARAAESARAVNAAAYTVGQDVVFAQGRYQPESRDGQQLIAHELVHTVQQSSRAWSGGNIVVGVSESAEERYANRLAAEIQRYSISSLPRIRESSIRLERSEVESDEQRENVDPGDCAKSTHSRMQEQVNAKCKAPGVQRNCDDARTKEEVVARIARNQECIRARLRINSACYGGGDPGHRQSVDDTIKTIGKCHERIEKLRTKNVRRPVAVPVHETSMQRIEAVLVALGITAITVAAVAAALSTAAPVAALLALGLTIGLANQLLAVLGTPDEEGGI